jgi:hypothetical protein
MGMPKERSLRDCTKYSKNFFLEINLTSILVPTFTIAQTQLAQTSNRWQTPPRIAPAAVRVKTKDSLDEVNEEYIT